MPRTSATLAALTKRTAIVHVFDARADLSVSLKIVATNESPAKASEAVATTDTNTSVFVFVPLHVTDARVHRGSTA